MSAERTFETNESATYLGEASYLVEAWTNLRPGGRQEASELVATLNSKLNLLRAANQIFVQQPRIVIR